MRFGVLTMAVLALACSVRTDTASDAREQRSACQSNAECGSGQCLMAFGVCGQKNQGDLTRLLFEVTPPASDPVYGGARFLTIADLTSRDDVLAAERGIAPGWLELNVRPRVPVSGFVTAAPEQTACLSRARSTLPVTLTFTPRERLFGFPAPSYEVSTRFDEAIGEHTFNGLLPPGHYDVYMRPDTSLLSDACVAIPQIFRDRSIGETFALTQPAPAPLLLTLPWRDELEGWLLDMVHPVTGEVISNRVLLSAANRAPDTPDGEFRTTLYYSRDPDDFISDGDELVRLTPPPGSTAGTVLLQRSGIVLATRGEGRIGDVFRFGTPVDFRAWVWRAEDRDVPVPATASFAALELDEVDGVPTSFSRSATVNERGEIRLTLLPGSYRVRVTPPSIELEELGLRAAIESTLTVLPNETEGQVQAGQVLRVPPALELSGRVVLDAGGQPLAGAEVRAFAANAGQDICPPRIPGGMPTSCDRSRNAVRRKALAQDPFVARSRGTYTDLNGEFDLTGLDCGQCEPGAGARFDLSVRPPPELGLPWLLQRGYNLYQPEFINTPLRVPVPVAHALRLTYGDPTTANSGMANSGSPAGQTSVPTLAGALVRVYALLDEDSDLLTDSDAKPCVVETNRELRCVQSVLQVAELRSGKNGELLLLLPPTLGGGGAGVSR